MIRLKRIYEPPNTEDGQRILVERLWPRGLSKQKAAIDAWLKDVAPSAELRKWYGHDPSKWPEFRRRYQEELKNNATAMEQLNRWIGEGTVTLVYATRDEEHNSAIVLKDYLERN